MKMLTRQTIVSSILFIGLFYSLPVLGQASFCPQFNTPCWSAEHRPTNAGTGAFGYNITDNVYEVWNGKAWTLTGTGGNVDISQFGARCDNLTDDSAAINQAIAFLRMLPAAGRNQLAPHLTGRGTARCVIKSTLNLTNLTFRSTIVELPQIECQTTGKPCIDGLGSRNVRWVNVDIYGDCGASKPLVGIQVGRAAPTQQASSHYFDFPVIYGCFTRGNLYQFGTESTTIFGADLMNFVGQPALIQDGANHFKVTSDFVTETAPVDTCTSFNGVLVINSQFGTRSDFATGPNIPIWKSCYGGHRFVTSYACSACSLVGTPSYGMMIYMVNDGSPPLASWMLDADIHMEPNNLISSILVAGNVANPTLLGLRYTDYFLFSTRSILAADSIGRFGTPITSITVRDLYIEVSKTVANTVIPIFDTPALWTVYGNLHIPFVDMFSQPKSYSGNICAPTTGCFLYMPSTAFDANPANCGRVAGANGCVVFRGNKGGTIKLPYFGKP
jgi:hypothetical protein